MANQLVVTIDSAAVELFARAIHASKQTGVSWDGVDVQQQDHYRIEASYVLKWVAAR